MGSYKELAFEADDLKQFTLHYYGKEIVKTTTNDEEDYWN